MTKLLARRRGMGPTCPLCYQASETVDHLLVHCHILLQYGRNYWADSLFLAVRIMVPLMTVCIIGFLWVQTNLPLFSIWGIWRFWNLVLFEDVPFNLDRVCRFITVYMQTSSCVWCLKVLSLQILHCFLTMALSVSLTGLHKGVFVEQALISSLIRIIVSFFG